MQLAQDFLFSEGGCAAPQAAAPPQGGCAAFIDDVFVEAG
jgi:hypothetical protein